MTNSQVVSALLQGCDCEWANESAAANEKDFHICISNFPGLKPRVFKIALRGPEGPLFHRCAALKTVNEFVKIAAFDKADPADLYRFQNT